MEDTKILARNSPLPEEIIADILLRLPVKSLLKFRCVSKSWCFLISSKRFAKTHLQASTSAPSLAHQHTLSVLPFCTNWFYSFNYCSVSSLFSDPSPDFDSFDYPINKVDYRTRVVGCCNGLCCVLVDGKDFVLWNPCTRKYRKLPDVCERYLWVDIEGFGYDDKNDDYKILVVLMVSWFGAFRSVFRLYSLKTNSWKTVDFMSDAPFKGQGVFVSGKLHWVKRDVVYRGRSLNITSFDLGTEAVGSVPQPRTGGGYGVHPALGVLDGRLCVLCDNSEFGTEVWVMKEYGKKESWSKVMRVPYDGRPVDHSHITLSLLYTAPDGQVLLKQGSSLFVYHPKKKSFKVLKLKTSTALHGIGLVVESLVSPFPDAGRLERN